MVCTMTGSDDSQFWFVSVWFTVVVAKPRTEPARRQKRCYDKAPGDATLCKKDTNKYAQNDVVHVGRGNGLSDKRSVQ